MPKRSSADLATLRPVRTAVRVACNHDTPDDVRAVFAQIVQANDPDHFAPTDAPLLEQYAQAIVLGRRAYAELSASGPVVDGKSSPWLTAMEKAHRSAVALAARLRICPQSRFDRLKAGTTARGGVSGLDAAFEYISRGSQQ
jgi:hypothetical protein